MKAWLPWLAAIALGLVVGAGTMALVDRRQGEGVRDYLLAHPEVIAEAMQRLRDRDTAPAIAARRPSIETPVGDAWAGNPHGDVTLVEYYDYNCGFCRTSMATLAELVKSDPNVRVVYRELPVLAASSRPAALASLAAARQRRFAAFHAALFGNGQVSEASIADAASRTGVALPAGASAADEAEIDANLKTAGELGMTGTPGWVVGDRVLVGAQTLAQLQDAVAAVRGR